MMQQAGRPVEQYFVQATDENRHGITPYARFVATGCLLGAPAADLAQRLGQFVERRLAAAAKAKFRLRTERAGRTHRRRVPPPSNRSRAEPAPKPMLLRQRIAADRSVAT